MKVAIITPHYTPAVRGNAVTVRRIERSIAARGCDARVFPLDSMCAEEILSAITSFSPQVIHAFHGCEGGRVARIAGSRTGVPYVITFTGTDLYGLSEARSRNILEEVVLDAAGIVVFDRSMGNLIIEAFPQTRDKVAIIPQGVEFPKTGILGGKVSCPADGNVFFLPAGVRPVKNVLFPLAPLARIYRENPSIRLVLAGPVLDPQYAVRVLETYDRYPFAKYVGEIDHCAMWSYYMSAFVVLNTSQFEGGMANSVLEAMAAGRPVLASAIPGNRSLVKEGETGLLYANEEEFQHKALALLQDPSLCRRLGEQGEAFVKQNFSVEREGDDYVRLYSLVVKGSLTASSPP